MTMLNLDFKPMLLIIKQKRNELNYSQEYIALKLKTSQNAYSKIELGQTKITVDRFIAICKILELDANQLIAAVNVS